MPARHASPALSETAFDISSTLFPDENNVENLGENASDEIFNNARNGSEIKIDRNDGNGESSDDDDEAFIASRQAAANKKNAAPSKKFSKKAGSFVSMGLNAGLLKAISHKGFSEPTPIQRKVIPLLLDHQDVVGMARTGSGKTAAFVIPMIQQLKTHSAKVGARALLLSPSRELALQTLKAVREIGRGTDLRSVLIVGGDSLETQFSEISSNPDIIVATPGRFLHIFMEMRLDLSTVRYVVFDEADRLFEMGFSTQLTEILHALPMSRQTLLFSATLPKSLVEFAKAGLRDPHLVRLDAESKVSPDLESVFLTLKSAEKEGALLHLLQDVIKVPPLTAVTAEPSADLKTKKRKRAGPTSDSMALPAHSTIIFAATKHHVEYLTVLLKKCGFSVSYVYGTLDQTARLMQVDDFRSARTNVLIVTDVAARGIDLPLLANVINYDFPAQPKIFVHRVGRTARAGSKGWSYSLVQDSDIPYLLDLQSFLGKSLAGSRDVQAKFSQDVVVGSIPRTRLETTSEWIAKTIDEDDDLAALRDVAGKGEKMYMRSRNAASIESVKRGKKLRGEGVFLSVNPLYAGRSKQQGYQRDAMLKKISGFRPAETVFEMSGKNTGSTAVVSMRRTKRKRDANRSLSSDENPEALLATGSQQQAQLTGDEELVESDEDIATTSEDELAVTYPRPDESHDAAGNSWRDGENFMSYQPREFNAADEKGYGVHSGGNQSARATNFSEAARTAVLNLSADETKAFGVASHPSQLRWDKRSKKYVRAANDGDGSLGKRMVVGESGQKIAASFRSGRFEAWRQGRKLNRLPKVGDAETSMNAPRQLHSHKFKHFSARKPKTPDKYRDDYHSKKKKLAGAQEIASTTLPNTRARNEIRSVDDVRKQRTLKAKRREKNARPSRRAA